MILGKFRAKNYKNQSLTTDSSHYKSEESDVPKHMKEQNLIKKDEQLGSSAKV